MYLITFEIATLNALLLRSNAHSSQWKTIVQTYHDYNNIQKSYTPNPLFSPLVVSYLKTYVYEYLNACS